MISFEWCIDGYVSAISLKTIEDLRIIPSILNSIGVSVSVIILFEFQNLRQAALSTQFLISTLGILKKIKSL